jgi:hypothetical protein
MAKKFKVVKTYEKTYNVVERALKDYSWPARIQLLWDTSAIKLDYGLGKPFLKKKKK